MQRPTALPANFLLPTSPEFLRLQGSRRGAAGGLYYHDTHITYAELSTAVDELAAWLVRRGVGAGDHVGVIAANEPAFVASIFALWGIGAVAVPISVRSTVAELEHLLAHARATAVLCDSLRTDLAREAARAGGIPLYACEPD